MLFTTDDVRAISAKASEAEAAATPAHPYTDSFAIATDDGLLVLFRGYRKVLLLPFRPDLKGVVLLTEEGAEKVAKLWNDSNPGRPVEAIPAGRLCAINANRYRRTAEGLAKTLPPA